MKFDPSEVLATVERLRVPGFAGDDGARSLSEYATTRLTDIGWLIEPVEAPRPVSPNAPNRPRSGFIARRPSDDRPSCRVVLQAELGREHRDEVIARLGSYLWSLRRRTSEASQQPRPLTAANLSGLAVLLELARTWPKTWSRRMELVVAATAGHVGVRSLARCLDPAVAGLPTLLLPLIAPGVGHELIVIGGPHRDLAIVCARSLWVPVSDGGTASSLRRFWPASAIRTFPDYVALIGAGLDSADSPNLDTSASQRVAQLVAEISLRWAKGMADHSRDAGDFRSESRSSQNPG